MEFILIAAMVVGWFALMIWLIDKSFDGPQWLLILSICCTLSLAGFIYLVSKEEDKGPCLRKETSMMYNAATKTMMPYTYCVERGEWIKE